MATKGGRDDLEAVRTIADALTPFESADQERIIRWAREKVGLLPALEASPTVSTSLPPKPAVVTGLTPIIEATGKKGHTIKSFIEEKDPKNDRQLAAVVAYYHAFEAPEEQRKNSITSQDIIEACRLAQKHRPKKSSQTLINAAHSGLLDKAEETGAYKLNAVGENLVAMALPGGAEGRRVVKRPAVKKKTAKKTATKRSK